MASSFPTAVLLTAVLTLHCHAKTHSPAQAKSSSSTESTPPPSAQFLAPAVSSAPAGPIDPPSVDVRKADDLLQLDAWPERVVLPGHGESKPKLSLFRSADGRRLLIRHEYPLGEFMWQAPRELVRGPEGAYLQFVDGITEPLAEKPRSGRFITIGNRFFDQPVEAWVFTADGQSAIRPKTGQTFPVHRLDKTQTRTLQWTVFVRHCPGTNEPCVLTGTPKTVSRTVLKVWDPTTEDALLFSPAD